MKTKNSGFTLIELTLAMVFVSFLLISIALSTISAMKTYNFGLTLKGVNQAGRDIGDLLKRDSAVTSMPEKYFVEPSQSSDHLGRLCLGSYSYIWGDPSKLQSGTGIKYTESGEDQIVLARVSDRSAIYCQADDKGKYRSDVSKNTTNQNVATELLKSVRNDLAVRDVDVNVIEVDGQSTKLLSIKYVIGTNEKDTINTSSNTCKPPADAQSNFDFCAVNQFEVLIPLG